MALYHLYVVELAYERRSVYVGYSAFSPSRRMLKHLQGTKASKHVRKHGRRLRPDLCRTPPLRSRPEAKRAEKRLAVQLEERGYVVYGACRQCPL